jgi:hypothetical protein
LLAGGGVSSKLAPFLGTIPREKTSIYEGGSNTSGNELHVANEQDEIRAGAKTTDTRGIHDSRLKKWLKTGLPRPLFYHRKNEVFILDNLQDLIQKLYQKTASNLGYSQAEIPPLFPAVNYRLSIAI